MSFWNKTSSTLPSVDKIGHIWHKRGGIFVVGGYPSCILEGNLWRGYKVNEWLNGVVERQWGILGNGEPSKLGNRDRCMTRRFSFCEVRYMFLIVARNLIDKDCKEMSCGRSFWAGEELSWCLVQEGAFWLLVRCLDLKVMESQG